MVDVEDIVGGFLGSCGQQIIEVHGELLDTLHKPRQVRGRETLGYQLLPTEVHLFITCTSQPMP
jgi:hypothetical protein